MSNKETGKRRFQIFHGNDCREEKDTSLIIRILQIQITTEKIELAG